MGREGLTFPVKVVLAGFIFGCVILIHQTQTLYNFRGLTGSPKSSPWAVSLRSQDTNLSGFDVRKADLKFLPQFKSPCWLEPYTDENVYTNNLFVSEDYPKKFRNLASYRSLPNGGVRLKNPTLCGKGSCRLRCLPYFMLIGVHKSGTTDISNRLTMHPLVFSGIRKEIYWWNQLRFSNMLGASLGDYADLFDMSVMKMIENKTVTGNDHYPGVLGEFTAMTFFDMSHWRDDPLNKGQMEPAVTTPTDIYRVNPNIKLLVSLRNPTSRLYSHYNLFHGRASSPQDFHQQVVGSISWWRKCVDSLPQRNCAYGSPPEMPYVYDSVGKPSKWWNKQLHYSGEIRTGMYAIHAKEWLKVFPRDSILFIKMEEYSADLAGAYNQQIFPFLGIHKLDQGAIQEVSNKTPSFQRKYSPMLEETMDILDKFYKPFNEELANLLGDKKWLWNT